MQHDYHVVAMPNYSSAHGSDTYITIGQHWDTI